MAVLCSGSLAMGQGLGLSGRVLIHVNGGVQSGDQSFRRTLVFRAYGEDARFDEEHRSQGGGMLDVGGSVALWRQLSVGVSYTQLSNTDTTTINGRVPNPVTANAPRTIASQEVGLAHEERGTHLFVAWSVPIDDVLTLSLFAGPSFLNLTQGVVTGVEVAEVGGPPWSEVSVGEIATGEFKKNTVGAHAGVDVRYMLTPRLGVGGFVRFGSGSIDGASTGGDRPLNVGGLQGGGGLRFRF